jgi:alpha-glucosidase
MPTLRAISLLLLIMTGPFVRAQDKPYKPPTPKEIRAAEAPISSPVWWKHAVLYEIYPRSFQDTNGDGIGDLNGITQRLDYLESLGVDAIWLAPIYPSPQVDFGYDISNYTAVDPQYGTLADFDRLLAAASAHHIRILLDMVLNHTSDKHPWFLDSASSRTNPHADWYIWNDGKPTTDPHALNAHHGPKGWVVPPNNWSSLFHGSAWEWVPARGQFYYHFFYKQQPDLNWRNPAVEKAMFDVMRFWLDRGVAGFRLDAITTLFEDPKLRDEPLTGQLDPSGFPETDHSRTSDLPEVHDVLRRLRKMTDSYPDNRVLVGEIYVPSTTDLLSWYGTPSQPELQLPMDTLVGFHTEGGGKPNSQNFHLSIPHFRQAIMGMETELDPAGIPDQPLLVFDNHDNPRSWDRFGDAATPANKARIARIVATILYTTRSTALTYYGAEIGMTTHTPTRKQDVRDPIGITGWPKEKGRDGERTPMQWTPKPPAAGFSTTAHTWLPVGADYPTVNVATEIADPKSLLNWNRTLIALRRTNLTLYDGGVFMLDNQNPAVLSYVRTAPAGAHPILISLNFTAHPQTVHLDLTTAGIAAHGLKPLLASDDPSAFACKDCAQSPLTVNLTLPPYASLIAEVQ